MDNIFENNPKLKEYFKTSDGSCFYTQNSAANHAKSLSDKSVEKVEREKAKTEEPTSEEFHEEITEPGTETKKTKNAKK